MHFDHMVAPRLSEFAFLNGTIRIHTALVTSLSFHPSGNWLKYMVRKKNKNIKATFTKEYRTMLPLMLELDLVNQVSKVGFIRPGGSFLIRDTFNIWFSVIETKTHEVESVETEKIESRDISPAVENTVCFNISCHGQLEDHCLSDFIFRYRY